MKNVHRPEYPRMARQAGIEGDVWVRVLVDRSGSVREALLFKSSGTQALDHAALAAAPHNRFEPSLKDGEPIPTWITYRVSFSLERHVEIERM
jgi:periplasmic protein TonB